MKLSAAVLATRDRYVAKFPLWTMPPGDAAEQHAREWTLNLIAQIGWEHVGQGYGSKRADAGRPLSKDSIARLEPTGTLLNWDMLSGTGTGQPSLNANPDSSDITGQLWEFVQPRDVIGGAVPPTPTPQPPASVPPYNESYAIQFGLGCNDVYKQSGAAFDPGMISVHSQRAAWDYYSGSLSWDASYKKHMNEFRHEYGLPPV